MCNRARFDGEPATLFGSAAKLFPERPRDNRFNPQELRPKGRAYVIREQDGERGWDIMSWDVLGGQAAWPMTNVRNLKLPQWRKLAADPSNRCLVPLTEFCEWTPDKHDVGDGKPASGLVRHSQAQKVYLKPPPSLQSRLCAVQLSPSGYHGP